MSRTHKALPACDIDESPANNNVSVCKAIDQTGAVEMSACQLKFVDRPARRHCLRALEVVCKSGSEARLDSARVRYTADSTYYWGGAVFIVTVNGSDYTYSIPATGDANDMDAEGLGRHLQAFAKSLRGQLIPTLSDVLTGFVVNDVKTAQMALREAGEQACLADWLTPVYLNELSLRGTFRVGDGQTFLKAEDFLDPRTWVASGNAYSTGDIYAQVLETFGVSSFSEAQGSSFQIYPWELEIFLEMSLPSFRFVLASVINAESIFRSLAVKPRPIKPEIASVYTEGLDLVIVAEKGSRLQVAAPTSHQLHLTNGSTSNQRFDSRPRGLELNA